MFQELKQSEWYSWYKKISRSEKTMEDIFSGVEKKLINDILAKIKTVKELQNQIDDLQK